LSHSASPSSWLFCVLGGFLKFPHKSFAHFWIFKLFCCSCKFPALCYLAGYCLCMWVVLVGFCI
jgi:hypothetical protein